MKNFPWLKSYPDGIEWDQSFEPRPIHGVLEESAGKYAELELMRFAGRHFTYAETLRLVNNAARGLQDVGVGKGTRVGIFLPNCPQYVIAFYAILKAGGTVVNLSPLYSEPELLHQMEDSEADIVITANAKDLLSRMQAVQAESGLRTILVTELQWGMPRLKGRLFRLAARKRLQTVHETDVIRSFDRLLELEGMPTDVDIAPEKDIAVLQYTGGTTGLPKGAMLSHANITINLQQALAWDTTLVPGEGRVLAVLPFFHAYAMTVNIVGATAAGASIVIHMRLDVKKLLKSIGKDRITLIPAVPTLYTAMLNHPDFEKTDFSSVKSALSGAAPLPEQVKRTIDRQLPITGIREGYGLTETSPVALANPTEGLQKINSVGLPVPATEILFTDPENPDSILEYGETGEINIRGPQVMMGYWKKPEATDDVIHEGRLRTGDIGYMDEDGYTFIIDRVKDMILVSGFNVYPRNIEEAIYAHPGVREATVIGIPHSYHGEVPKAYVVRKNDARDLSADKIAEFLKSRLGRHEMPQEIEFREELPKTMVGKISKRDLVDETRQKSQTDN